MADFIKAYARKNDLERARLQTAHLKVPQKVGSNFSQGDYNGNFKNDHADRLAASRRGVARNVKSTVKDARNILSSKTASSLLKEMDMLSDLPFMAAFGAAILKDAFDLADFATVVLPFLFSMLCGIFIFMMLLLAGAGGKMKTASNFLKKGATIIGGSLFDAIPGLDLLPIETMTVLVIYLMTLHERKQAREMESDAVVAMA